MYKINVGQVSGREHKIRNKNYQDAYYLKSHRNHEVAILCDGCGSGIKSESGAQITSVFAAHELCTMIDKETPFSDIPYLLGEQIVKFLGSLLNLYHFGNEVERVAFIANHLLFTLYGAVASNHQILLFGWGDGLIAINKEVHIFDSGNAPYYLGYQLVKKNQLTTNLSDMREEIVFHLPANEVYSFGIASDGWAGETDLLDQVLGLTHPAALQRRMNVWSNKNHRFEDDSTLIIFEREGG
jgi:hypothetical protein